MSLRGPIKSPSLYFTSAQPIKLEKFCGLYRRKRGGSPTPRGLSCLKGNWGRIAPDSHAAPRYPDWNTASPSARRGQATQPAPAPPPPGSSPSGAGRDPQQATKRRQPGASFTVPLPGVQPAAQQHHGGGSGSPAGRRAALRVRPVSMDTALPAPRPRPAPAPQAWGRAGGFVTG